MDHKRKLLEIGAIVLVVGAIMGSACAAPPAIDPSFNRPEDVARITASETALDKSADVARALEFYAPDAVAVTIWAPGWQAGSDQLRPALASRFRGVKTVEPHIDEINVATDGTLACAASVVRFDIERQDGRHQALAVRELDAWRKSGGRWRIIQQHLSVPVDMASGRPLLAGPLGVAGPLAWAPVVPAIVQSPAAAKAEIRHWLEVNAVTPTVQQAMDTYGPSDDIILFDVSAPKEHRGLADLRSYFNAVLGAASSLEYKLPALRIDSDGRMGVQISRLDLKITAHDGTNQFMSFRQSDCLRRIGRHWYPVFEMGSFPIDAVTGKAIMAHPEAFAGSK